MQFGVQFLSTSLVIGTAMLALFGLVLAAASAQWHALLRVGHRQHAWLGAVAILALLWSFRFEVIPGLYFHPLLMSAFTLIFGWSFAVLGGVAALLLVAALGRGVWSALPLDAIFTVFLPATLCWLTLKLLDRVPTRNLFAYLLGLGFFGTLITTFINAAVLGVFVWLFEPGKLAVALWDKALFIIPVLYSEGFINGMIVTAVTVYLPDLVKTFDDRRYLGGDSGR